MNGLHLALSLVLGAGAVAPTAIAIPGTGQPIGFDDLQFSRALQAIIVPAGGTGRVDLLDARTGAVSTLEGLSATRAAPRGHEEGTTSADFGGGFVFASDRPTRSVAVLDPGTRRLVARAQLAGGPDYVRWVESTQEVWVTEPGRRAIEIFRLARGPSPHLARAAELALPAAPESLVVDPAGGRAYTNSFHDATFALDVGSRAIVERWRNTCRGARGIALDAARGLVFVGCEEGRVVALDTARGGAVAGEARAGAGIDSIAYSAQLGHLYVPAADAADVTVVGVRPGGLEVLGAIPAARGAHCAAADDAGSVYVCDPGQGRLLVFHDPYPASR